MIEYYDRNNRVIGMDEYSMLLSDFEYKRVASTDVGPYWVSTVWLGLDHSFLTGPPLIFETMVFHSNSTDEALDEDLNCVRYTTEHQAVLGHFQVVAEVQDAVQKEVPYYGYNP